MDSLLPRAAWEVLNGGLYSNIVVRSQAHPRDACSSDWGRGRLDFRKNRFFWAEVKGLEKLKN